MRMFSADFWNWVVAMTTSYPSSLSWVRLNSDW